MTDNKGLWAIGIILIVLFLISQSPNADFFGGFKNLFSIVSDSETQLKQEYTTLWASNLDGIAIYRTSGENDIFTYNEWVKTTDNHILLSPDRGKSGQINLKQNLYGKEAVVLIERATGGANINGYGITTETEKVIIFRPHTFDLSQVDIIENGIRKTTMSVQNPFYLNFVTGASGGSSSDNPYVISIAFIGYKAQYSCDLSENEVWIQENFAQPFNIKDLEFLSTKFCKETRPFVLRDIQQGETPIYPDPIPSFNRGDTLQIPSNKIGVVNYATYFVNGVNNKCAPNEANIKVAGKWICSQVIRPVEIVVQCKQDSDCYIPQKPQCFGYFKGCQNNKCSYDEDIPDSPVCKNEVVTIVKQIQEIDKRIIIPVVGTNSFTFSQNVNRQSFNIGNEIFTATPSKFICGKQEGDFLSPPNPNSNCWQTTINYGKLYPLTDTQSISIHPLINVQYFAGGKLTRGEYRKPEDWDNTFIFTINTAEALNLNVEDSSFVLKDNLKQIKLNIQNNLPKGGVIIKVQQKVKQTNQNLPEQTITKLINNGDNEFIVDMNTQNLGINQITIQIFYKIRADTDVLIPSDKFILNYDVITELPTIDKIVTVEVEKIVEKQVIQEKIKTLPTSVKVMIGIIIAFIILRLL